MDVDEKDVDVAVVADAIGVLVTLDGGCTWSRSTEFEEFTPNSRFRPQDVDVARAGNGRILRVLATPLGDMPKPILLLTSGDDGRTWSTTEMPLETAAIPTTAALLEVSRSRPSRLYVLTRHMGGSAGFSSSDDAGATWRWSGAPTPVAPADVCPAAVCSTPRLKTIVPDPDHPARVWGLTSNSLDNPAELLRTDDAGISWKEVATPPLAFGPSLLDVAPMPGGGSVVFLLGDHGEFALSRNDGDTWEVGRFPEVAAGPNSTKTSFDLAHASGGSAFATLLGQVPEGSWAGNLMVLSRGDWYNASPDSYAGFDRTDSEGRRVSFSELTGSGDSFVMLSSLGRLAVFRPRR